MQAKNEKKMQNGKHSAGGIKSPKKGDKKGGKAGNIERVNGAPVYTAVYKVNHSDELLEFLLRKCNTSRNNVKSLLVRRQVLVNGRVVTQYNFMLAKDDEVKIVREPVREGERAPSAKTERSVKEKAGKEKSAKKPFAPKLTILYEDEELIAVDKPIGLLSVESDKETDCAFGLVLAYLQSKDKNARPFILHRIDKETSGVLLFAKDVKIHSMLRMNWNELVQSREYVAVCEGAFEKKEDTIISYLRENANNLVYSTQDPTGQKAITHYKVEREGNGYSFVRVRIDTGRKNQIRVHMQLVSHPIVGDDKYGYTKNPIERLGLHASCLTILHPITKELMTFRSPVPASFHKLFAK
jgi:23S rRNA pseudouridine1911/1915/1917 synthase